LGGSLGKKKNKFSKLGGTHPPRISFPLQNQEHKAVEKENPNSSTKLKRESIPGFGAPLEVIGDLVLEPV
jgi:hypothetical protein